MQNQNNGRLGQGRVGSGWNQNSGFPLNPQSPDYERNKKYEDNISAIYAREWPNGTPHQGQSFWEQPEVWGPLAAVAAIIGGPSIFNAFSGMAGAGGAAGASGATAGGGSAIPAASGYAANAGAVGSGMGGYGLGTGTAAGSAAASMGGSSALNAMAKFLGNQATDQMTNKVTNSVMGMFQPKPSVIQPQQQVRNNNFGGGQATQPQQQSSVINPGSPGGSGGGSAGMMNIDPGLREKIQGWFGGRSPQEAFSSQRSQGQGFGSGNTSFGGF